MLFNKQRPHKSSVGMSKQAADQSEIPDEAASGTLDPKWQPREHLDSEGHGIGCSYPDLKSSMQEDVYADFSDSVEPDSKLWKKSNFKKIVKATEMFGSSLNEFQKFYLSISLNTYLNSTMRNGGGSIVDIKYGSRDQVFEIRTVDTFHYKYSKNADYGTSMRRREVTLGVLLSQYGLPKSSLDDGSAFREAVSRIKIEPQGKDVAYKLIFMALASRSGIGTVKSDPEGIYLANIYGEKVASVGLGEIKQDARTFGILEAGREILEWSLAARDALYKAIDQDSVMKSRTKRSLMDILDIDGKMMKPIYFFFDGISMRVSEAYSRFEGLSNSELSSLANDFIMEASALEESLREVQTLLPNGAYRTFDTNSVLMSDKRYISGLEYGMSAQTLIDSCIKVLEAKRAQIAGMASELSKSAYVDTEADFLRV